MDRHSEEPNLNSGKPWYPGDDIDIRWALDHGQSIEEIADFLCRTTFEVRQRIEEIAEADKAGNPAQLYDGMNLEERASLENYRDARDAMALIREAIEDCAPPGTVPDVDISRPEFTAEAERLVRGIYAITEGPQQRRERRRPKQR